MKLRSVADYPLESQSRPLKTELMHRLEIRNNHIRDRVGHIQMREFRTVDASKMLKAIAEDNDLSKNNASAHQECAERCFHSCEE
jgi:hypothetical protein